MLVGKLVVVELHVTTEEHTSAARLLEVSDDVSFVLFTVAKENAASSGGRLLAVVVNLSICEATESPFSPEQTSHSLEDFVRGESIVGGSGHVVPEEHCVLNRVSPVITWRVSLEHHGLCSMPHYANASLSNTVLGLTYDTEQRTRVLCPSRSTIRATH